MRHRRRRLRRQRRSETRRAWEALHYAPMPMLIVPHHISAAEVERCRHLLAQIENDALQGIVIPAEASGYSVRLIPHPRTKRGKAMARAVVKAGCEAMLGHMTRTKTRRLMA